MPNTGNNNRGGSYEQHVKAGQQSHKNSDSGSSASTGRDTDKTSDRGGSSQGGTHEQHVKAGQQSHKNS